MKELSVFIDESGDFGDVAEPQKYRLLQVADFICSLELLRIKKNEKRLSKLEEKFFYNPQELRKTFFKSVEKKRL